MLDVEFLRKEPEKVKEGIAAKKADAELVDDFLKFDAEWRAYTMNLDEARSEQKKLSANRDVEGGKKNKEKIKDLEASLAGAQKARDAVLLKIPNLPSDDTPRGTGEEENKVLRENGKPKKFSAEGGSASGGDFEPKDHLVLGEALGLIDVETASKVSGTRFAYLKGDAVRLEFALVQYALEILSNGKILQSIAEGVKPGYSGKPFIPVLPPVMIRPDVLEKMARLEPREERYHLEEDDLYLIGSAEHTLGPLHMGQAIPEADLPVRYAGFSSSFRREAGSYGKDTKGILRVHQFDKLELESFTAPEDAVAEQDFFVAIQEYLMWSLEIPHRVVLVCTGDMGGPAARQIDIETWMPAQNKYRETHSADLTGDYQARRLNTKIRRKDGKTEFAHMNDATAFAIGRTIIAIMENYQTKDGKIEVPKVLQKYVAKKVIG